MRKYRIWLTFLFAGFAWTDACFSQPANQNQASPNSALMLAEVERRADQAEQDALVQRAVDRIEDAQTQQAYNRFEIWMGALVGFFATLITILVVVFGVRTEKAAARAATAAAKEELSKARQEVDEAVTKAQESCRLAEASLTKIQELEGQARESHLIIEERVKSTALVSTTADEKIDQVGSATSDQSDPWSSLIEKVHKAEDEEDWEKVIGLSIALKDFDAPSEQDKINNVLRIARAYDRLEDHEKEADIYKELITMVEESSDKYVKSEELPRFLLNLAVTLGQTGNTDEELRTYDHIVSRFASSDDKATLRWVARAEHYKGISAELSGNTSNAVQSYQNVITMFGDSDDHEIRTVLFQSMVNLGSIKRTEGDTEAALALWQQVIDDCPHDSGDDLAIQHAYAMFNRGKLLNDQGNLDEATRLLRSIVRKFGKVEHKDAKTTVDRAKRLLKKIRTSGVKNSSNETANEDL